MTAHNIIEGTKETEFGMRQPPYYGTYTQGRIIHYVYLSIYITLCNTITRNLLLLFQRLPLNLR